MKKIGYLIPIIFLILAIGIMESGNFLKNIGKGDKIPEILTDIESEINNDNWEIAETKVLEIRTIFNKTYKLIQFSVERDEIFEFKYHLALLEGYLKTQDKSNTIAQVYILHEYWIELGN